MANGYGGSSSSVSTQAANNMSLVNTIDNVIVDTSTMSNLANSRSVKVVGNANAAFSLQVSRSSNGHFYDFSTGLFSATYSSQSRLTNLSPGTTSVNFPASSSGDTYTIYIWPEPHLSVKHVILPCIVLGVVFPTLKLSRPLKLSSLFLLQ